MLALAVLLVVLVELWRRHRPVEAPSGAKLVSRLGSAARVEGLPTGVSTGADDPWDEAQRRRERGDYAGAVICLFAHQLLTLDRLRLIRLVPGRTGRQLIRTIVDPQWQGVRRADAQAVRVGLLRPPHADSRGVRGGLDVGRGVRASGGGGDGLVIRRRAMTAVLAVVGLGPLGCSEEIDATYGRMRGASVNGTGALAELFRQEGHTVRAAVRLTDDLAEWADVIVRFAPTPGPPGRDEADWYDEWLDRGRGSGLIYVPRDYDAQAEYWQGVLEAMPKTADASLRARVEKRLEAAKPWSSQIAAEGQGTRRCRRMVRGEAPRRNRRRSARRSAAPGPRGSTRPRRP